MRISNQQMIVRTYEVQRPNKQESPERMSRAEERTDMVTLSSRAKDFSVAKKALDSAPDIRAEKVEGIKARIEAGTYNVTGMDVAEKLFAKIS